MCVDQCRTDGNIATRDHTSFAVAVRAHAIRHERGALRYFNRKAGANSWCLGYDAWRSRKAKQRNGDHEPTHRQRC
jgi:hypothetical protein